MVNQGQRNAVERLIYRVRKLTRVVQLLPFANLLIYASYLLVEPFLSIDATGFTDYVLSIIPMSTFPMLIIGRLLDLCNWYKAACVIPLISSIENFIDTFIFQFTQREVIAINILIAFGVIIFILSSIRHFFYNGRKQTAG